LIRYIDDFVVCFQHKSDAKRFEQVLAKRLDRFSLALEPSKTQLLEFGRFAQSKMSKPKTVNFLGFTHYLTRNRKGNFKLGHRTEKSRLRRAITHIQALQRQIRHDSLSWQRHKINQVLRGHFGYYGFAGNINSLKKVYRATERYWQRMLSSRSRKSYVPWDDFHRVRSLFPLQRPKLSIDYHRLIDYVVL